MTRDSSGPGVVVSLNRVATIRGSVLDETGKAMAGVSVHALTIQVGPVARRLRVVKTVTTDAAGQYKLGGLSPSKYYVAAQPEKVGPHVSFPSASSAEEAQGTARELSATRIDLRPAENFSFSGYKSVKVSPDGTFSIADCDPARHSLHVVAPAGPCVERLEYNRQVMNTGLMDFSSGAGGELVVGLRRATGSVQGTLKDGDKDGFVMLIPARWTGEDWHDVLRKQVRNGTFRFYGVPPGQYVIVATEWYRDGRELEDAEVLEALMQEGQSGPDLVQESRKLWI